MNRKRATTLILVTHERDLAAAADRIIELKDGAIVSEIEN
jgi:predicted ABC-type transport system involved in lysophospholipase L1 biosynthesis ATPase subunit